MEISVKGQVYAIVTKVGPRDAYDHVNGYLFPTMEQAAEWAKQHLSERFRIVVFYLVS